MGEHKIAREVNKELRKEGMKSKASNNRYSQDCQDDEGFTGLAVVGKEASKGS